MTTRAEALHDLAQRNLATTIDLAAKGVLTCCDVKDAEAELAQYAPQLA
jgi:hypothetical protein